MKLKILGSSSAGNCYVFDNGKEALVVECGVHFKEVRKVVDFDISRIVSCLVSHIHADHSKYYKSFTKNRIPVFCSCGTKSNLGIGDMFATNNVYVLDTETTYTHGNFLIIPFNIKHDAPEPFGFLIHHPEMGTTLFATDTIYLEYTFEGLNNILIECNYRQDILDRSVEAGSVPKAQRDRTIQSHMSYERCLNTLLANNLSAVNNIVLIHLSEGNSNALEFEQGIREATGKTVHIAEKGMILEFNKTPF